MATNTSTFLTQHSSTPTSSMASQIPSVPVADYTDSETAAATGASLIHDSDHADEDDDSSTIGYEHEPFETFRHKVAALMTEKFGCCGTAINIKHIKGGAFNRVIGAHLQKAVPQRSCFGWVQKAMRRVLGKADPTTSQTYVVRMPREGGDPVMESQVATLKAIEARLPFPTPRVVHYDVTSENIFDKPYMVQEHIPGAKIYDLLESMSLKQVGDFLCQFIQCVDQITSIEAAPGVISVDNLTSSTDRSVRVNKITATRGSVPSTKISSLDHLLEVCKMRRQHGVSEGFCYTDVWDGFEIICKSLKAQGFLEGPCVLVHGDLESYNLLGEVTSPSTVKITGVIDWDEAHIAPKVIAYISPFWLWTNDESDSGDEDMEKNALVEPTDSDDRFLQRVFLENASEGYKRFAFSPEAMLARRMYYFFRYGLQHDDVPRAEAIIAEWDELHPEDHAILGETYFLEDGTWRDGAYDRCKFK